VKLCRIGLLDIALALGVLLVVLVALIPPMLDRCMPASYVTRADMRVLGIAGRMYHDQFGAFPDSLDELCNTVLSDTEWESLYLHDSWGNELVLTSNATTMQVWSIGKDHRPSDDDFGYRLMLDSGHLWEELVTPTSVQFEHAMTKDEAGSWEFGDCDID